MSLGIYISIPFCRSKCTFCNFASGVFSHEKMNAYVARLREEIVGVFALAVELDGELDRHVDSIYLGGGTPTVLDSVHLRELLGAVYENFDVQPGAEISVECAPGTLRPDIAKALLDCGVNRVSLGTQSFIDQEIKSVGRLHTAQQTRSDIVCLRQSGINNLSIDLMAGLPHQTSESWRISLEQLGESEVPHVSVYMLEIDEDSRLGRELLAGGIRYHAHHVPDSDLTADLYVEAVDFLSAAGLQQYEISNFAKLGYQSRHNLKYWTRQPYLGFGLDAHSMLKAKDPAPGFESVRFSNSDDLSAYLARAPKAAVTRIIRQSAAEEQMFLALRLNRGVDLATLPMDLVENFDHEIRELQSFGLVEQDGTHLLLTARGRLLSNEVFERFIGTKIVAG